MNQAVERGKRGERELVSLLNALTGWPIRRALGNGRADDCGDLLGLPSTTAQCKNYSDPARALRDGLAQLEEQRANAGTPFAVVFVRHRGGKWVVSMTPEMFCTLLREATQPMSHAEPKETSP